MSVTGLSNSTASPHSWRKTNGKQAQPRPQASPQSPAGKSLPCVDAPGPNDAVVGLDAPQQPEDDRRDLPREPGALAAIVQGLLMHEHVAPAYGLKLSGEQHAEAHVRPVEQMLQAIAKRDPRPLSAARAAGERQVGVCRHFTLLHVAMLRSKGVAARARCGFGAYFEKGKFVDHWVTEYWNEPAKRWIMVDPQLDARHRELFKIKI